MATRQTKRKGTKTKNKNTFFDLVKGVRRDYLAFGVFTTIFAIVGVYLLLGSFAATSYDRRSLSDVSCPTTTFCLAVGTASSSTGDGFAPIAKSWNGSSWTELKVPAIAGQAATTLRSVDCPTADFCMTVGYQSPTTGAASEQKNLAFIFSNGVWTKLDTPSAWSHTNSLDSVSCVSAKFCMAVGKGNTPGLATKSVYNYTSALAWDGSIWQLTTPLNPGKATNALSGVSCTAVNNCISVGTHQDYAAAETGLTYKKSMGQMYNGTSWALQPSMTTIGNLSTIDDVACVSSNSCTAIGDWYTNDRYEAITQTYNGTSWSAPVSNDISIGRDDLTKISCVSTAAFCMAVGGNNSTGISILNTGAGWSTVATAPVSAIRHGLNGVSCATANFCVAVGYSLGKGDKTTEVIEHYVNGTWTLQSPAATTKRR